MLALAQREKNLEGTEVHFETRMKNCRNKKRFADETLCCEKNFCPLPPPPPPPSPRPLRLNLRRASFFQIPPGEMVA